MSHQINHVFYLDDDPDDHEFFLLALNEVKSSARLHSFHDCGKIIEHLKGDEEPSPDLIFIDQNIRGNTENECLIEIRKLAKLEHIPVIVYTTGGTSKMVAKAMESGASKYITKPAILEELKSSLHSIVVEYEK